MRAKTSKRQRKMQEERNQCVGVECVEEIKMEGSIFICPICFKTMTDPDEIVECYRCQKLFCFQDYNQVSKKNSCPYCALNPWEIVKLHPIYKEMLEKLTFHCQKCEQFSKARFTHAELEQHLEKVHNATLSLKKELKKYQIYLQVAGYSIDLTDLQNVYVNYMLEQGKRMIKIGEEGYNNFNFSVKNGGQIIGHHPKKGACYLINHQTEQISGKNKWNVWEISMDGEKIMLSLDLQAQLEAGYRKYIEKPIKSEIYFDLVQHRYRVNYIDMTQTNTSTGFVRPLTRHIIKF